MIKIQKTRKPHKKDVHNKKLNHLRKFGTEMYPKNHHQEFLNSVLAERQEYKENEEEVVIQEKVSSTPTLINDFSPKIITPVIPDADVVDILKNPKLLQDFKQFQEFLKMRDSPIIPATPAPSPMLTGSLEPLNISPTLSPITEENHSKDLVNYVSEDDLDDFED